MDIILQLIDFILHIDVHLGEIIVRYGALTYAILFAIVFAETGLAVDRVREALAHLRHGHHITDDGKYMMTPNALAGSVTVVDLATVQTQLCQRRQLAGYEIAQRFYEIGSPEGLAELDRLLSRPGPTTPT